MSNSPLVSYTKISPNKNSPRNHQIDRITPHCVVGQLSAERICDCFPAGRNASCNYGIGTDGRVSLCVYEKDRSWCSSNPANDNRAVTIECASDMKEPYAMNSKVYESLVKLCLDICKRNGKNKLLWLGNKDKSLNYAPKSDEMILTVHRWFANKSCPGNWLYAHMGDLATQVTNRIAGSSSSCFDALYRVQTGAFSKKANADAMVVKIKAVGFDAYLVQVDGLYKVQIGAYKEKANAEAQVEKIKEVGFNAFITMKSGSAVSGDTTLKSISEIAREVLAGKWGNGEDRKNRLTTAGYDYNAVQVVINKLT